MEKPLERIPGIRITYDLEHGDTQYYQHKYNINYGFFKQPHVTHPRIEQALKKESEKNTGNKSNIKLAQGTIYLTTHLKEKRIIIGFEPIPMRYREELERSGLGSIIEYLVLRKFAATIGRKNLVIHNTLEKARKGQMAKTGRTNEQPITLGEEIKRLGQDLKERDLLKHINRFNVPYNITY